MGNMSAPPVAKPDFRPSRSQIDALLVGIEMRPDTRCALLDAFEKHGLLAYTQPELEVAADELGRLSTTRVNQALKAFDQSLRSEVVSVLEQVNAIA
jgi:hypothetical protein